MLRSRRRVVPWLGCGVVGVGIFFFLAFDYYLLSQKVHQLEEHVQTLQHELRAIELRQAAQAEAPQNFLPPPASAAQMESTREAEQAMPPRPPPVEISRALPQTPQVLPRPCAKGMGSKDFHGFQVCEAWLEGVTLHAPSLAGLATQLSVDRLDALQRLVDAWQAPISAAVYIKNWAEDEGLLRRYMEGSPLARRWLTLSLLFQQGVMERYPVQTLRNLAMRQAGDPGSAQLVLMLDVDFVPSNGLAKHAWGSLESYSRTHRDSKIAFVVPAFEPTPQRQAGLPMPQTKVMLLQEHERGLIQPILHPAGEHASHITTNYPRWLRSTEDYPVQYEVLFEPYVAATTQTLPAYDERFNAYGNDKCSHALEMAARRYEFIVLSDAFIVHAQHKEALWAGAQDNDKAWEQWGSFMDEIQTRYGWRPETPHRLRVEAERGELPDAWMKPAVPFA